MLRQATNLPIKRSLTFIHDGCHSAQSLAEEMQFVLLGDLLMVQNALSGHLDGVTGDVVPVAEPIPPVVLVHCEETPRVLWTNENGHILLECSVNLEYKTPQYVSLSVALHGHSKSRTDMSVELWVLYTVAEVQLSYLQTTQKVKILIQEGIKRLCKPCE
jgi:hypothetical protein